MNEFDVLVVGAGHAGCEAATAAARMGASVALITQNPTCDIGAMSCNPAIGGVGKGHLVREVDVFDGLIARAADDAAIHYRMLNASKGSAVWGPRVQADRRRFRASVAALVAGTPNVTVIGGHVAQLALHGGAVGGVALGDGATIHARAIILATGTFLGARLHRGADSWEGGRAGEAPATALARQLQALALPMARLKTGTPARIDGRTIDWARLDYQPSDENGWTMSPLSAGRAAPQIACAITRTTPTGHEIIRAAEDRSPLYSGAIGGQGPRYCPSIEDKVRRFADRESHQIFLEPEGLDNALVYPNGISTSLPEDVQTAFVRSLPGLERATIAQFGYAVDYAHIDPRSLEPTLESRLLPGLFCAGQINGTTGYEEAAAQGLVAGLNAAAHALDRAPILFDRTESYIGVMVDDLTLQGVTEPYRMLTSRAEFRLRLRADNACTRLGELALSSGAIGERRRRYIEQREARRYASGGPSADGCVADDDLDAELIGDARYAPYLDRQRREVEQLRREEALSLAAIGSYRTVRGLSNEMVERLEAARPTTLGAARRIRGITPAALTALMLATRRKAA